MPSSAGAGVPSLTLDEQLEETALQLRAEKISTAAFALIVRITFYIRAQSQASSYVQCIGMLRKRLYEVIQAN